MVVIVGVEINVLVTLTLWVEIFLVSNKELMLLKFTGIPLDSEETVGFVNMLWFTDKVPEVTELVKINFGVDR